jgi:hypothetical protein
VNRKVSAIFHQLVGDRACTLTALNFNYPAARAVAAALSKERRFAKRRAYDIGFHLVDWGSEAAFLVAFQLFPERFTAIEIETAVEGFLIHVPNHLAAAAALFGHPVADVFEVGALGNARSCARRPKKPRKVKR